MSAAISLKMSDVAALRMQATGLETLRALAGPTARPLGHDRAEDYAFLAVQAPGVIREFVFFPGRKTLIEYDIANPPGTITWKLEGSGSSQTVVPELHLIQMGERQTPGKVDSDDLAGLQLGALTILFHTEPRMAQSAVSFDVKGPAPMKFLIAGMAPGVWEIWRAGMREQDDVGVEPQAGILRFEGKPGSYFLRAI